MINQAECKITKIDSQFPLNGRNENLGVSISKPK